MAMRYFCTIFDKNYQARFLTMYYSLTELECNFMIFAFCMDSECYLEMQKLGLDSVILVKYTDLEQFDAELYEIKTTRSLVEYYFTCTPAICNYVFVNFPYIDLLTYLDSDLYFFSSPEIIFEEIGKKSIAIVEHRFSKFGRKFIKLGIFNVAWITFRRDDQGIKCLSEYRQDCLEWCYDYLDGEKYADQKYLDKWPENYSSLVIIKNKGVNLAAWNIGNYSITKINGSIFIDENKLVFYHFAGLKQLNPCYYISNISSYYVRINNIIKTDIYGIYLRKLKSYSQNLDITQKTVNPKNITFSVKKEVKNLIRIIRVYLFNDLIKS